MQEIELRAMTRQDCPEMSRVICASFAWAGKREGLSSEDMDSYVQKRGSESAIRDQCNDYRFWVAIMGGRICGMVAVEENEITKLYIDPAIQRHSVGRMLFELAERIVAQGGHADLTAWAAFDSAIPFYEKMGMSAAGRKFDILGKNQGTNTMLMKKSLVMNPEAEPTAAPDAQERR